MQPLAHLSPIGIENQQAVHLTDVFPRIGPVSGGTRLVLRGSNLNVGSRVQVFLDDIPCAVDSHNEPASHDHLVCITAPNLLASSMRITRLTLMIDNSTHHLPYPFTYQPDPIITQIEPAESFLAGGRLILIAGKHLGSPQSTKLMVYHEHKRNIINGTNCKTQNDTLIICLTPAISRDLLHLEGLSFDFNHSDPTTPSRAPLGQDNPAGLKLKMSLFMDDVKSVRNLDEYYHHLPHYLTYFEDPRLFRLAKSVIEFSEELEIMGENLRMRQLDQDILITIGASHICPLKSIQHDRIVCQLPETISPHYDENGRLLERTQLPIVALIGANLRYPLGYIQYSARQYQHPTTGSAGSNQMYPLIGGAGSSSSSSSAASNGLQEQPAAGNSPGLLVLVALAVLALLAAFGAFLVFAMSRFRQSKAEREYRRIQLQMGSLDVNGQPLTGNLFDTFQVSKENAGFGSTASRLRALDCVATGLSGKKLLYQLNQPPGSFPASPQTDISSLTGSNNNNNSAALVPSQHVVKLAANGTIQHYYSNNNSSQSSPSSTRNSDQNKPLFGHQPIQSNLQQHFQHQPHQQPNSDKGNLLSSSANNNNNNSPGMRLEQGGNSQNFSWTQRAPSTIVPYAVIKACNLTLEGMNAIKDYV